MNYIGQGAEAIILKKDNIVIKDRVSKNYRIKQLDESLRKFRTKRELKVMEQLYKKGFDVPRILKKDKYSFEMEFIGGPKIKDILDTKPLLAKKIGDLAANMHNLDIIHGDLTTSNMIFHKKRIFLIDFGLSSFSRKLEDKAVDIHLFKQALESKHHTVYNKALKLFLQGYSKSANFESIMKQLAKVESRGRYAQKK